MNKYPVRVWQLVLLGATSLLGNRALAAEPTLALEADIHFKRGVQSYKDGRYEDAIERFALAYQVSNDPRYLFNLGQAYAVRWRPVEALDAFERYLRDGRDLITKERRKLVEEAIAQQMARIAWLKLRVAPTSATVKLDGKVLRKNQLAGPVTVASGEHLITVASAGYQPLEQVVTLKEQEQKPLDLTLTPNPPPPRLGQVAIECQIPDVSVFVDEHYAAKTPVGMNLLLTEGPHELRFQRVGYRVRQTAVDVRGSDLSHVPCEMSPEHPLEPMKAGTLTLLLNEPDAAISVDGKPAAVQTTLPSGAHMVEIHREGFLTWRQIVWLPAARENRVWVALQATPEHQRDLKSRAQVRRNWALGLGTGGVVAMLAAGGIYLWNDERHKEWQTYDARGARGELQTDEVKEANKLLISVKNFDAVTAGLAVAGGVVLVGATYLLLSGGH